MRKNYEQPMMFVEEFMTNSAVSTCTVEGGIAYDFDCMFGPNVDTEYVIADAVASGCTNKIGYASGISVARDYSSGGRHSNNNSSRATWEKERDSNGSYLQVSYTGAEGIIYTDYCNATKDAEVWSVESDYVKHSSKSGGMHHMVAPVIDSRSVNASW